MVDDDSSLSFESFDLFPLLLLLTGVLLRMHIILMALPMRLSLVSCSKCSILIQSFLRTSKILSGH